MQLLLKDGDVQAFFVGVGLIKGFQTEREGTIGCFLHKSPKFYNNDFLLVGSSTLGTLINFDLLSSSVQTCQPLILSYRRGNFVYYYWRWTSIYLPLSYFFRLLCFKGLKIEGDNLMY